MSTPAEDAEGQSEPKLIRLAALVGNALRHTHALHCASFLCRAYFLLLLYGSALNRAQVGEAGKTQVLPRGSQASA